MSDALKVYDDYAPWLPSDDVRAGKVLDLHNVPRAGLLHSGGTTYYFECILGDGEPTGLWAYARIDDSEMAALLAAHGPEEVDDLTEQVLMHRWVTVAMAAKYRIVDSTVFDAGQEGSSGLTERFTKHLDCVSKTREDVRELACAVPSL
jgi:hypothetical protein